MIVYFWNHWFHLIYGKEEYLNAHPKLNNRPEYLERLEAIYDHPMNYNRLPSQIYYDIVCDLIEQHFPLRIEFKGIIEYEDLQANSFNQEKKLKDYDLRDFITEGVTAIVKKK